MKCLKTEMMFNYLNDEMKEETKKSVREHLENCKKCQTKLAIVKKEIQLISDNLSLLEPTKIPDKHFVVPSYTKKRKKSFNTKFTFSVLPAIDIKKGLAFSAIILCLLTCLLLKKKSTSAYEEVVNHVVSMELSFMADPKQDLNENSLYMSVFDGEKMQLQIVRTSGTGETISHSIIPFNK